MNFKNPSLASVYENIARYLKEISSLKKSLLDAQLSITKSIKVYQVLKNDKRKIEFEKESFERKNSDLRQTINGLMKSDEDQKSENKILLFENDKLRKKNTELELKIKEIEKELSNSINNQQNEKELTALHNQNVMLKNANLHLVDELNATKKENKKLREMIKELVGENYFGAS